MPPGIVVPSFEQKQYGNWQAAESHFCARSIGVSVIGAGAEERKWTWNKYKLVRVWIKDPKVLNKRSEEINKIQFENDEASYELKYYYFRRTLPLPFDILL